MKWLLYVLFTLVILYVFFIIIAPGIVENKYNSVTLESPYQVSGAAVKLHEGLPFIADLHSDALLWDRDLLERSDRGHVDIPRMEDANVALQVFTIVSKTPKNQNYSSNSDETDKLTLLQVAQGKPLSNWFSLKSRALYQAEQLREYAEASEGRFRVIESRPSLEKFLMERKNDPGLTAGILGVEGAHMLEGQIENLADAYSAGIRILAPVHFFDNELGGSAHGEQKGGLTAFGRQVIRQADSLKMIIDLSHGSPALIEDILATTERPVIVTHTGVRGTCDNNRNLTDSQLKKIAKNGGLVGIAMFEQAVCGTDAEATANAIKYVADLIGINHVALGSDFDGAVKAHFDVTGIPLITEKLLELGFQPSEISRIMGENARDFFLHALPDND